MPTRPELEHVVVGAGISGLYAALLLARAGRRVRIVERAPRPGGLAAAETFRGVPCDLGSHRLHPDALDQPLFREIHARAPFLSRPRRGVLLLGDRRVPYPPDALSMIRAIGPRAGVSMAVGLLAARRRRAFAAWDRARAAALQDDDIGFERFVIDRVGAAAYASFYRPYAEKVWGLPPAELSQTVAKKRVSTTDPLALLRGIARPAPNDHFLYPPGGVASIIAYLEARLANLGVRLELGAAYPCNGGRPAGAPPVLYAGHLADLVPDARLEHRGLYLIYLALPCQRLASHETYYAPDPRLWFGRVSELQNYSPALRREDETVLCVEIPEGAWGQGVDFAAGPRLRTLLDQLASAAVIPRGVVPLEVRQRFVPNVYPVYRRGWIATWRRAMRRAAALGVLPFGRQALFLHCNLDHCATIAGDAVAHVEAGRSLDAWLTQVERYVDLQVRD